jgi:chromosome partitioning protein
MRPVHGLRGLPGRRDRTGACEWLPLRTVIAPRPDPASFAVGEVPEGLPQLREEADYVVCDGPGSQTETSRALLMWADLAVIPCKASMFEARALAKNTAFVRQAQAIRKGPPHAVAVLSMVGKDFRLTNDIRDAAAALTLPLAATHVTLRQAYADAPGQSTLVWRMGSREKEAAKEIAVLFEEVLPEACSDRVVDLTKAKTRLRVNAKR